MRPIEQKTLDFIAEIDRVDDSESVRLLFQRFLEVEIGFTNVVCLKVPNAAETLNSTIILTRGPRRGRNIMSRPITSSATRWCASSTRPTTPTPGRMS